MASVVWSLFSGSYLYGVLMFSLPDILIAIIALLHVYIMIMEMFMWTKPRTLAIFGMTKDEAETSKTLAANLGIYNGFLAAGLVYGLVYHNFEFKAFFLICVLIAGIFGGLSATKRILFVQALPALVALVLLFVGSGS